LESKSLANGEGIDTVLDILRKEKIKQRREKWLS
jgi:hypothetical protein